MLYVAASVMTAPDQSSAVRALLARSYQRIIGGPMPEIVISTGGKPDWRDSPWHFSLCHTRGAVLCAISDAPVGLDAERIRPVRAEVVSRVLAPQELRQYDGSAETFLRFWTLKEAYAKYTGEGIIGYPNRFVFRLTPESAEMEGNDLRFATVRSGDYIVSVCTPKPETLTVMWENTAPIKGFPAG